LYFVSSRQIKWKADLLQLVSYQPCTARFHGVFSAKVNVTFLSPKEMMIHLASLHPAPKQRESDAYSHAVRDAAFPKPGATAA
jgi:hypothetical protein